MREIKHILKVLEKTKFALEKKEYITIKQLSNKVIHESSIEQDADLISLAVIIYSLSKLIERESYKTEKNWNEFYREYLKNIDDMTKALRKNNIEEFRMEVNSNRELIQNLSGNLKTYIQDVFRRAQINKASRIYEHGISMEKTAKILGISIWELAEYAGRTGIADVDLSVTMPIKKRVEIAEEIFE